MWYSGFSFVQCTTVLLAGSQFMHFVTAAPVATDSLSLFDSSPSLEARAAEGAVAIASMDKIIAAWPKYATGDGKSKARIIAATHTGLVSLGMESKWNDEIDDKEIFQHVTSLVWGLSDKAPAEAGPIYKRLVQARYTQWVDLESPAKEKLVLDSIEATNGNRDFTAITHDPAGRHAVLSEALTITTQFLGQSGSIVRAAERLWNSRLT